MVAVTAIEVDGSAQGSPPDARTDRLALHTFIALAASGLNVVTASNTQRL